MFCRHEWIKKETIEEYDEYARFLYFKKDVYKCEKCGKEMEVKYHENKDSVFPVPYGIAVSKETKNKMIVVDPLDELKTSAGSQILINDTLPFGWITYLSTIKEFANYYENNMEDIYEPTQK